MNIADAIRNWKHVIGYVTANQFCRMQTASTLSAP